MCSWKSCFHGAGGRAVAEGAVVDIVRKIRERRPVAMREAMVAILEGKATQSAMRVCVEAEGPELLSPLL